MECRSICAPPTGRLIARTDLSSGHLVCLFLFLLLLLPPVCLFSAFSQSVASRARPSNRWQGNVVSKTPTLVKHCTSVFTLWPTHTIHTHTHTYTHTHCPLLPIAFDFFSSLFDSSLSQSLSLSLSLWLTVSSLITGLSLRQEERPAREREAKCP